VRRLDGDAAVRRGLLALVDDAHAAAPEHADDAVGADGIGGRVVARDRLAARDHAEQQIGRDDALAAARLVQALVDGRVAREQRPHGLLQLVVGERAEVRVARRLIEVDDLLEDVQRTSIPSPLVPPRHGSTLHGAGRYDSAVVDAPEYDAHGIDDAVYAQLKDAARALLEGQRPSATITPTSLVHDAYLRVTASERARWASEAHFRAAAARAMRHILVDRARRRATDKHGAGWARVSVSGLKDAPVEVAITALSDALEELGAIDPRGAEIVEMRFLAGMTSEDVAKVLDVSLRTVERDWRAARAWLLQHLDEASG